jgi:hypothetical protein
MSAAGAPPIEASLPGRSDALLLPEGSRLVHIGPHKTGTTALQAAFHLARARAEAQGVHYAGYGPQPVSAVLAGIGRGGSRSRDTKPPSKRLWQLLVAEIRRAGDKRVLLSSEFLADAEPEAIARVVADLDPARVHVVATLRPLARIIPSQWQQYVQNRLTIPFEDWLDAILNQPRGTVTPTFWQRHRHDELVARWADAVGPANVTVVALPGDDRETIFRVFEELLGLASGTLAPDTAQANRSMTLAEIEVLRAFNVAYKGAGLPRDLYERLVHRGAAALEVRRVPDPSEGRVVVPAWASESIADIARTMVASIASSGVRVVGDLDALTWVPDPDPASAGFEVSPDVAASAMLSVVLASGIARTGKGSAAGIPAREPPELFRVSTMQLGIALLRRGQAAIRDRVGRLFRGP